MRAVILGGFYGFGNVGDEAVAATVIEDLRRAWPDCRLILTSERPELTRRMHGVEAVGWREIAPLLAAVETADHVVIGGGGLWNSYFPFEVGDPLRDTSYYAQHVFSLPLLARLAGKPATLYGIGAGVIHGDSPRRLAALGACCAGAAVVRDENSRAFISALIGDAGVPVAADPAFRLSAPAADEAASLAAEIGWAAEHRPIVVVVREWLDIDPAHLVDTMADLLRGAAAPLARPILFIPFDVALEGQSNYNDDEALAERIAARLGGVEMRIVRGEHHPRAVARLIEHAAAVLSMRLHGCILAVRAGVPVLGVAYDPKVAAVLGDIGLSAQVIGVDEVGRPDTAVRLARMATDRAEREVVAAARALAIASSARGPGLLEAALRHPRLPALPPEAAALQARYAAGFLGVRAAAERRLPALADMLRSAIQDSRFEAAQPLAALLTQLFPETGEWPYMDAIARSRLGAPPAETLPLLEAAEQKGFAPQWVLHVSITERLRAGNVSAATADLDRLTEIAPDHAGTDTLRTLVEAARSG